MGTGKGFVNVLHEGVAGGFGNIEAALVIEGALVEIPILRGGAGQGDSGCLHGRECIDDKLVGRGGFRDFRREGSIEHLDVEVGEENLFHVVGRSVYLIFSGQSVGWSHGSTWGVVPFQVIVLEEHLPSSLAVR